MLVKYYLSDNIKTSLEDSALGLRNIWAGPEHNPSNLASMVKIFHTQTTFGATEFIPLPYPSRSSNKHAYCFCSLFHKERILPF